MNKIFSKVLSLYNLLYSIVFKLCIYWSVRVDWFVPHDFCYFLVETKSSLSDKRQDASSPNKKSASLSFNKTVVAPEGQISVSNTLRAFSYHDLKNAAKNFRSDSLLGEGGFGWVYKAWLDENSFAASRPGSGISVAIKKLKTGSCQGHREWLVCLCNTFTLYF